MTNINLSKTSMVITILSALSFGLLSPVAIIIGIIAVRQSPNKLAKLSIKLAVAIPVVYTLLFVLMFYFVLLPLVLAHNTGALYPDMRLAYYDVDSFKDKEGRWPSPSEFNKFDIPNISRLRFVVISEDSFSITHHGNDRYFDTKDDLVGIIDVKEKKEIYHGAYGKEVRIYPDGFAGLPVRIND